MPVSNDIMQWGWIGLIAFAVGTLIGWLLMRARVAGAHAAGRGSREAEVVQLRTERDASEQARARLHQQHEAATRELEAGRMKFIELTAQRADYQDSSHKHRHRHEQAEAHPDHQRIGEQSHICLQYQ